MKRLVVPGRFQPPHKGHVSVIKYALEAADEVIVVIGSAQESYTLENPLTAGERMEALMLALEEELGGAYRSRVIMVPVADIEMNKVWVQYLKMMLPRFDGVVSGNELVLMLFEDMGLEALRPPMYNRSECSGTRIRSMAAKGGDWSRCLHRRVAEYLRSVGFEERLRRLSGKEG